MENQVRILHPSPINPSPLVVGNPRMAAAAVDAFFFLLNLVCFICSAQSARTLQISAPSARRHTCSFSSYHNILKRAQYVPRILFSIREGGVFLDMLCSHIIFPAVYYLLCQNTCTQDARPCHNRIHHFNGHSEDTPWI